MKKKWIVAFIAAGVLLLGGVTVCGENKQSEYGKGGISR